MSEKTLTAPEEKPATTTCCQLAAWPPPCTGRLSTLVRRSPGETNKCEEKIHRAFTLTFIVPVSLVAHRGPLEHGAVLLGAGGGVMAGA